MIGYSGQAMKNQLLAYQDVEKSKEAPFSVKVCVANSSV